MGTPEYLCFLVPSSDVDQSSAGDPGPDISTTAGACPSLQPGSSCGKLQQGPHGLHVFGRQQCMTLCQASTQGVTALARAAHPARLGAATGKP